ncbi:MAG: pyridoxamine 5'-phosphate oxidase family protein [Acidimicrobiia bacterium]|nr:pyridoxamine 5'-phosphate oxidase family protein [Acidimicrobiia bacterium]
MGLAVAAISDQHRAFIEAQHLFFVATAPSGDDGHVNLSPKGYDTLVVRGPNEVAYLDLTGSGAETIAHLRQNGRITFLFCAFEGKPNLLRLHGHGQVVAPGEAEFIELAGLFPSHRGARAVIVVEVDRVSTSCGYSVPFMSFEGDRPTLDEWVARKSEDDLVEYRATKNATSIDGLPSIGSDELAG